MFGQIFNRKVKLAKVIFFYIYIFCYSLNWSVNGGKQDKQWPVVVSPYNKNKNYSNYGNGKRKALPHLTDERVPNSTSKCVSPQRHEIDTIKGHGEQAPLQSKQRQIAV